MIVASWAEPWFEDAAVNTVFTVLEKTADQEARDSNIVHFVKLKKKLSELIPERDLQLESMKRWQRIDGIVYTIESAQYKANKISEEISSFENENLLVRMIKQNDLKKEVNEKGELSKWGKYLRAPDVYFEILEKCKDKLTSLKSIADVRRGITTGINEFFYLQKKEGDHKPHTIKCKTSRDWIGEIEEEYLKTVIKSPKESDIIIINPDNLKNYLFVCSKSKEELKAEGHFGALNYIEWGEKQRTKNNVKWIDVPSVQGRKYWWNIEEKEYSQFLWPKAFNDRFIIFNNHEYLVADRLYEITLKNKKEKDVLSYVLNSTVQHLFIEVNGRVNLGDGALDNMTYEAGDCEIINPKIIKNKGLKNKFLTRKIQSASKEVLNKDRIELDTTILEALGLDTKEYSAKIYHGVTQMVRERLELPKMRKKQKKQKVQISYDQVKESVIKECIGITLKIFPEYFYKIGEEGKEYDDLEFDIYNTSGKPLKYEYFMGRYTLKDESGQEIFTTNSLSKAEFAILLAKHNVIRLKIPRDWKVAETIVENYRNYIKQLKGQIELNANQKLHSWSEAEKMTKEILDEYGLLQLN